MEGVLVTGCGSDAPCPTTVTTRVLKGWNPWQRPRDPGEGAGLRCRRKSEGPHNPEEPAVTIPMPQGSTWRLGERNWPAHGHGSQQWQSRRLLDSAARALTKAPECPRAR